MLGEVLGDQAALRKDDVWSASGGLDGDDGGFAERVDLLELGRSEMSFGISVEDGNLVGDGELGEEPENALGAGFLEPGGASEVREVVRMKGQGRVKVPVKCHLGHV